MEVGSASLLPRPTTDGQLDCRVQSTDKNFLVPVGGAVIASCSIDFGHDLIAKVSTAS